MLKSSYKPIWVFKEPDPPEISLDDFNKFLDEVEPPATKVPGGWNVFNGSGHTFMSDDLYNRMLEIQKENYENTGH